MKTIIEEDAGGGYVALKVTPPTAMVFVDDMARALGPDGTLSLFLLYGTHTYRVEAPGYKPESGTLNITSDETQTLSVNLQSTASSLTLTTPMADAEIWVNNERKGVGKWTGAFPAGAYVIETRKAGCRTQRTTVTLAENEERTLTLQAPEPIFGRLRVESSPVEVEVWSGNTKLGTSPGVINNVPVGAHTLRFIKEGYESQTVEVTIEEGKIATASATLKASSQPSPRGKGANAYLTFEAIENTSFTFSENDLQYSLDGGETWTILPAGTASPIVLANEMIMWKASGLTPEKYKGIGTFSSSGRFYAEGNIMSLLFGDNFVGKTNLPSHSFRYLFKNCIGIENACNLVLPATTLATSCYLKMFEGCTNLTTAPELPATTLATYCYNDMFERCTSLESAPELPATTLTSFCYLKMFEGCTSLTTAPQLPATTLAGGCYSAMFLGCTSLESAPELPATTLADACCSLMFAGCTSLKRAPELPATTLADYCYQGMFISTSLTSAPKLPATTLADYCYQSMFQGCTFLENAPELPATRLAEYCYRGMFNGCTKLNYIKCLATDISATDCTTGWVNDVSSLGTFVKNASMTGWSTGESGIPSGWSVQNTK